MGKKRIKKLTVFGIVEGKRETCFFEFLKEVYKPNENNINVNNENANGGTADKTLDIILKNLYYKRAFAWLDEDIELSEEYRRKLAKEWNIVDEKEITKLLKHPLRELETTFNLNKRNPRLIIISHPVCVESLLLQILDHKLPFEKYIPDQADQQKKRLKNSLEGRFKTKDELQFYRENLTKEMLEEKRSGIPELDILISIMTP